MIKNVQRSACTAAYSGLHVQQRTAVCVYSSVQRSACTAAYSGVRVQQGTAVCMYSSVQRCACTAAYSGIACTVLYSGLHVQYCRSVCRHSCPILTKLQFSWNAQLSYIMTIRPVAAQLFLADWRTDRCDEASRRFSKIWAPKNPESVST